MKRSLFTTSLHFSRHIRIACLLLIGLLQPPSSWANEGSWSLSYTSQLGATPQFCHRDKCKKDQDAYAAQLIKVCLHRDPATSGIFTRGDWRALVAPADRGLCKEVLYADAQQKKLFIVAPFLQSSGTFMAGQPYIHCTPSGGGSGLGDCASDFFTSNPANPRFMSLNPSSIWDAVRESKLIEVVERHVAEEGARAAERQRLDYLNQFQKAQRSLQGIQEFEARYASNDLDGMIPQLANIKRSFLVDAYRSRFSSMNTEAEIAKFIDDYQSDDPDGLIPEARKRLAVERARVAAIAKVQKQERADEKQKRLVQELELDLIRCSRSSQNAEASIERENEIGSVSGFVNKRVLREAGETIVLCRQLRPRVYEEYRRAGGRRALSELQ